MINQSSIKTIKTLFCALFLLAAAHTAARAQASSGGSFAITQSVVAGGGDTSSDASTAGAIFSVTGTIGQSIAGTRSTNPPFAVRGGFWSAQQTVTAAAVTVSGRAVTADGRGIRNVRVTMTDASGSARTAVTGAFGYYRFADVAAGGTYIFQASGKSFVFAQAVQAHNISDDTDNIDFVAGK